MNAPQRYERFVLPEGTKKVSYERDTKIINAASFTIEREDHTVGNVVRMQLHRDPNVLFAGYKLPHPLQYKIIVRIHTTSQSSPMQAYNQAINDLDKELNHLKSAFEFINTEYVAGLSTSVVIQHASILEKSLWLCKSGLPRFHIVAVAGSWVKGHMIVLCLKLTSRLQAINTTPGPPPPLLQRISRKYPKVLESVTDPANA
ncbi:hypothetical protein BVC80_8673g10 [Macleaya cordata]|uniref:DNA-directed RNA polymerase RBP11-like dimerisation domain-containing protein n=1 Tax=Macleaya cordata TaxID=56857 RepID=A0A200PZV8_MACCD|nr:hypothetical protein BVC80_8673g10 [Macleaya cordata]